MFKIRKAQFIIIFPSYQGESFMDKIRIYRLPVSDRLAGSANNGRRLLSPAGELAQIENGTNFRYIAYVEFKMQGEQAFPRGNHYHKNKTEFLYIAQGKLRGVFQDLETNEFGECIVESGDLIEVEALCAHAYLAIEHTHTIEYTKDMYDPDDTYRYPLDFEGSYNPLEKINGYAFETSKIQVDKL